MYARFRQDEPWDSLHNKRLIEKMPAAFNRATFGRAGKTNAVAVAGPGAVFDGPTGVRKADLGDGAANTLLAVEAGGDRSVYWTKPADVVFAPGKPVDVFGGADWAECWAVFADGSTRRLTKKDDAARLPALVTRDGKD